MSIALADVSMSANFVIRSNVHEIIEVLLDRLLVQSVAIMLFSFDLAVRVVVTVSKLLIDKLLVHSENIFIIWRLNVGDNRIDIFEHPNGLAQVSSIIRFATFVILAVSFSPRLARHVVKPFILVKRICDGLGYSLRAPEVLVKFNYRIRVIVHSQHGTEDLVLI